MSLINGFALGSLGLILIGVGAAKVLIWKLAWAYAPVTNLLASAVLVTVAGYWIWQED